MKKNLFNVFLVCVFCVAAIPDMFAQQIKVTGKVTDSTNEGVLIFKVIRYSHKMLFIQSLKMPTELSGWAVPKDYPVGIKNLQDVYKRQEFLKEYYPILKGAAQFYMDFLVEHPVYKCCLLYTSPDTRELSFQ